MNPYKLISKLDNGTPLTGEEAKYLIDLVEQREVSNIPVEEIKDWIETCLDGDAHGNWYRAPNFDIIQDVAELMAPRFVEKLTTLQSHHEEEVRKAIEAERKRIKDIVQLEIDSANQSTSYKAFSEERMAYENGSRTAAMYIQKALDFALTPITSNQE